MRYIGIDVGSQAHVVAVVTENGEVLLKPTEFEENAAGYQKLWELLGSSQQDVVVLEATGHYWRNLVAAFLARGFQVSLVNPLRTRRAAEEELQRTKTDRLDALTIARFAAQKHAQKKLDFTTLPDQVTEELRELVHLRDRLLQDFTDRVRQLHRLVDLCFPEFTTHVPDLSTQLATTLLKQYPTASAFAQVAPHTVARVVYDGSHHVGKERAKALVEAARQSVGAHQGEVYKLQVVYFCEDLEVLRQRLKKLDRDLEQKLETHKVGSLLVTIDGVGPLTAAKLVAEVGDFGRFRDAKALAAYVGVVPGLKHSGKSTNPRAALCPLGNARLRAALWMPTLTAVRHNPWLKDFYERLRANGKSFKVAVVACMRKLLGAVYSVATHLTPFVPRREVPT